MLLFGLSKLILKLDELQSQKSNLKFEFLDVVTEKWGANQIQDNANLLIRVKSEEEYNIVKELAESVAKENNISFDITDINLAVVPRGCNTKLFVDVRQQYPVTGEESRDNLYNLFKDIQKNNDSKTDAISFRISSLNTPVKTSSEMLEDVRKICEENGYAYQVMHSWPGHDLACVLAPLDKRGKIILFFIPSEGGSHNPNEKTSKEAIEIGTDLYCTLVKQRMGKFREAYEKESVR